MRALRISGVSHGQQCDAQFVLNAIGHLPWFNGLDIRRYGDKLPKERLREIGVRANSIVTQQYMDILNEQGVKDPVGAAESIAYVVRVGLDWLATIRPWEDHEPDRMMSIRPSEMAVGPCPAAIEAAEEPIPRKSAKPLPLEACIHPAQCGCRYLFYAPERAETPMTEEEQALFDELMGSIRITISGPYTRSRSDYKSE